MPARCSRAVREAAVSRAKRGTLVMLVSGFFGERGVRGAELAEVSVRGRLLFDAFLDVLSFVRRLLVLPRRGCLTNLDSTVAEVGRSSNTSSSEPSPKARRRVGFVSVRFAAASRARDSGARSRRTLGEKGRYDGFERRDIGRFKGIFSLESEELGR